MALRLNEFVVRGEIRNCSRNYVGGWIELKCHRDDSGEQATRPVVVQLSLTGNLSGDLSGRSFRFQLPDTDLSAIRSISDSAIHHQQIGSVGDSRYRMVRVPLIPIDEFFEACKRGETPPETEMPSIYLEWYSQNGRVVLELLNPVLEFDELRELPDEAEPEELPPQGGNGLRITAIGMNDNESSELTDEGGLPADDAPDLDPFDLFPDDLENQIRNSAQENDDEPWMEESCNAQEASGLRDWSEVIPGIDPETKAMYEQWDEVFSGEKDEPLTWLFETPLCLPRPDDIRDEEHAWSSLNTLLAALALRGVAFDMCQHYSARRGYRLLIEDLLPQAHVHPNLVASGFIQHYSSHEFCDECDAEFEAANRPPDSAE